MNCPVKTGGRQASPKRPSALHLPCFLLRTPRSPVMMASPSEETRPRIQPVQLRKTAQQCTSVRHRGCSTRFDLCPDHLAAINKASSAESRSSSSCFPVQLIRHPTKSSAPPTPWHNALLYTMRCSTRPALTSVTDAQADSSSINLNIILLLVNPLCVWCRWRYRRSFAVLRRIYLYPCGTHRQHYQQSCPRG